MVFIKVHPTSPSKRNFIKLLKSNLTRKTPLLKNNTLKILNCAGKTSSGKISVHHKGNGCKKTYRNIDFYRNTNSNDIVISIEYDPYRTSFISAVYNIDNNKYKYILTPKNLFVGNIVKSGPNLVENKLGYSLPLKNIPIGSIIHNIALNYKTKSVLIRSAGAYAKLIQKNFSKALICLNSGKLKSIPVHCFATIGSVSNEYTFLKTLGKAGRARWLNIRPSVRGVAMNPIDHPNGGGEGKTSGKKMLPWSKKKKSKVLFHKSY